MYLKKSINENIELHKSLLKLQARIDFTIKKMFQSLTTGNKK